MRQVLAYSNSERPMIAAMMRGQTSFTYQGQIFQNKPRSTFGYPLRNSCSRASLRHSQPA